MVMCGVREFICSPLNYETILTSPERTVPNQVTKEWELWNWLSLCPLFCGEHFALNLNFNLIQHFDLSLAEYKDAILPVHRNPTRPSYLCNGNPHSWKDDVYLETCPHTKVHGANMGSTWVLTYHLISHFFFSIKFGSDGPWLAFMSS